MCAIVDANAAHEILGSTSTEAGEAFRKWIEHGAGRLVVGGKLGHELRFVESADIWLREQILEGRARRVDDGKVADVACTICDQCKSDDSHIVALAVVSGARLLYTNDKDLQFDFKNANLISKPRGRVFSTSRSGRHTRSQKMLLRRRDLCV